MVVDSRNDDFLLMPGPPEIAKDIHLTPSAVPNGAMDGTLLPNDGAVTAGRDVFCSPPSAYLVFSGIIIWVLLSKPSLSVVSKFLVDVHTSKYGIVG